MAEAGVRRTLGLVALSLSAGLAACAATPGTGPASPSPSRAACVVDSPTGGTVTVGRPTSSTLRPTVLPAPPTIIPGAPPLEPNPDQWVVPAPVMVTDRPDSASVAYGFGGDGVVVWRIARVDAAVAVGIDERLPILGPCILQLDFAITRAVDGVDPARLDRPAGSLVADVLTYPPRFGGQMQSFVGIRGTAARAAVDGTTIRLEVR